MEKDGIIDRVMAVDKEVMEKNGCIYEIRKKGLALGKKHISPHVKEIGKVYY